MRFPVRDVHIWFDGEFNEGDHPRGPSGKFEVFHNGKSLGHVRQITSTLRYAGTGKATNQSTKPMKKWMAEPHSTPEKFRRGTGPHNSRKAAEEALKTAW